MHLDHRSSFGMSLASAARAARRHRSPEASRRSLFIITAITVSHHFTDSRALSNKERSFRHPLALSTNNVALSFVRTAESLNVQMKFKIKTGFFNSATRSSYKKERNKSSAAALPAVSGSTGPRSYGSTFASPLQSRTADFFTVSMLSAAVSQRTK